jgi:hypothetical protein
MAKVFHPLQNMEQAKINKKRSTRSPESCFFSSKVNHRLWIILAAK